MTLFALKSMSIRSMWLSAPILLLHRGILHYPGNMLCKKDLLSADVCLCVDKVLQEKCDNGYEDCFE